MFPGSIYEVVQTDSKDSFRSAVQLDYRHINFSVEINGSLSNMIMTRINAFELGPCRGPNR